MKKKLRSEFNSRQYMLAESFEIFYYSDLHFKSVGLHSHPYTEVYYFAEGGVEMEIDGKSFPLRPGDVIVIPPDTDHRALIRQPDQPYRRFVFWLSREYCSALRSESPDYLFLFDLAAQKKKYIYHLDILDDSGLRSRLFSLLEELHTQRFGREEQIRLGARELVLFLNRCVHRQRNAGSKKEAVSSYQAITEYIGGHLEEDLSLDALSRRFFLNKYHIAHLFPEKTGLSLHQYITKKRLNACCEAMRAGENITLCCGRFGFQNYSSFYRAFVKEYGLSPSAYLRDQLYLAEQI